MEKTPQINLTPVQLKEIADDLDCGFRVFYHLETGEVNTFPDNLQEYDLPDEELECWEELEENWSDYFEIPKMEGREKFMVMEEFAESIPDRPLKTRLFNALNRPKPFRNFKHELIIVAITARSGLVLKVKN